MIARVAIQGGERVLNEIQVFPRCRSFFAQETHDFFNKEKQGFHLQFNFY